MSVRPKWNSYKFSSDCSTCDSNFLFIYKMSPTRPYITWYQFRSNGWEIIHSPGNWCKKEKPKWKYLIEKVKCMITSFLTLGPRFILWEEKWWYIHCLLSHYVSSNAKIQIDISNNKIVQSIDDDKGWKMLYISMWWYCRIKYNCHFAQDPI